MALLFDYPVRKEHRVVLIEWVDILDRDYERDTRIKTLMLAAPKPGQLLLPTCYGMVEDPKTRMFGLVLAPPAHIRSNLPPILPSGAISKKRMPFSLMELLEKKHPSSQTVLDLGIRFRLAKKLVDAVHMMHCVGWVHKYIPFTTLAIEILTEYLEQKHSLELYSLLPSTLCTSSRPPWT